MNHCLLNHSSSIQDPDFLKYTRWRRSFTPLTNYDLPLEENHPFHFYYRYYFTKINCWYLIEKITKSAIYNIGSRSLLERLRVNEDFYDLLALPDNYLPSTLKGLKRKEHEILRSGIKVYPSHRWFYKARERNGINSQQSHHS